MNVSVYIFGKPNDVYSQVPLDHSRALFEKFASQRCKDFSNIMMMHRDGNAVYYAGIQQLDTEHYIGVCLLMSGVIIYDVQKMFRLFQRTFYEFADRKIFLYYNDKGEIRAFDQIDKFAKYPDETQRAVDVVTNIFSDIDDICRKIPPIDYTRSNTEFTTLFINNIGKIDAIKSYSTVYFVSSINKAVPKDTKFKVKVAFYILVALVIAIAVVLLFINIGITDDSSPKEDSSAMIVATTGVTNDESNTLQSETVSSEGPCKEVYCADCEIDIAEDSINSTTQECCSEGEVSPAPTLSIPELISLGRQYAKQNNYEMAFGYYNEAAQRGSADAQYIIGLCYENGWGVTKSEELAVKWYQKAAEQGVVDAQFTMGILYHDGLCGLPASPSEAVKWYKKAAEQGMPEAQYTLACCYHDGDGTTKSESTAIEWMTQAAELGFAEAQYTLARCYHNGDGVIQNTHEAVKWYKKAAVQGVLIAQYVLGELYYFGDGVSQNSYEAVKWFHMAAEQGDADAQYNLGVCYENGDGVQQDLNEAKKWYLKAAEQGNKDAQEALSIIAK